MFCYSKTTQNAIAAMSCLAEVWDGKKTVPMSSAQIAKARNLPHTLVAKILTILSQTGLVTGMPGPGGGYLLAKSPARITLADVAKVFERPVESLPCPFGPGWCGHNNPCPMHDKLIAMNEKITAFIKSTTLQVFTPSANTQPTRKKKTKKKTRRKSS